MKPGVFWCLSFFSYFPCNGPKSVPVLFCARFFCAQQCAWRVFARKPSATFNQSLNRLPIDVSSCKPNYGFGGYLRFSWIRAYSVDSWNSWAKPPSKSTMAFRMCSLFIPAGILLMVWWPSSYWINNANFWKLGKQILERYLTRVHQIHGSR